MVCNLMKKANPVWQVILGLSRYPFFNHRTRRTHGNESSHRDAILPVVSVCSVVPWLSVIRASRQLEPMVAVAVSYASAETIPNGVELVKAEVRKHSGE
jgi:hypothetical protein